jgi:hypothetical protein
MSTFNLNSAIKSALRRIFSRSAFTQQVVKPILDSVKEVEWLPTKSGGKKKRVYFRCMICGAKENRSNTSVDHIEPVVGPGGFTTWDEYIDRMFCNATNLQVICRRCHDQKTKAEREARKARANQLKRTGRNT